MEQEHRANRQASRIGRLLAHFRVHDVHQFITVALIASTSKAATLYPSISRTSASGPNTSSRTRRVKSRPAPTTTSKSQRPRFKFYVNSFCDCSIRACCRQKSLNLSFYFPVDACSEFAARKASKAALQRSINGSTGNPAERCPFPFTTLTSWTRYPLLMISGTNPMRSAIVESSPPEVDDVATGS